MKRQEFSWCLPGQPGCMGAGRRPPDRDVLLYYECSYEEDVWGL